MASLERIQSVSHAELSTALPPVRVNKDADRRQHPQGGKEEEADKQDVLELHEEVSEAEGQHPTSSTPNLLEYEGLDLSA